MDLDIEGVVRRVPAWSRASLEIRLLSEGATDRTYVIAFDDEDYVVRIPGERTGLLGIDRRNEAEASRRAADLGIGPPVFGELPGIGTQITQLVPGRPIDELAFLGRLDDIVALVKHLHRSGPLTAQFPIHRVVEWHARDASSHGAIPPAAYERLHQQSRHIEASFSASPVAPVPSHNNLLPINVLGSTEVLPDTGPSRLWLVDFQYAGMNDVFFDLANLSVNSSFTSASDERLLALYFGNFTPSAWARLQLMKVMSLFRDGMWAIVQQAVSTLDTDFASYAEERLGSCERLAASAEFGRWLNDARRHPIPGFG